MMVPILNADLLLKDHRSSLPSDRCLWSAPHGQESLSLCAWSGYRDSSFRSRSARLLKKVTPNTAPRSAAEIIKAVSNWWC